MVEAPARGGARGEGSEGEAMAAAPLLLGEGAVRVPGRGACSPGDGGGCAGWCRGRDAQAP